MGDVAPSSEISEEKGKGRWWEVTSRGGQPISGKTTVWEEISEKVQCLVSQDLA